MDGTIVLDSYAAKTCPYALHLDRITPEGDRLAPSESVQMRIDAGNAFELLVGGLLLELGVDIAYLPAGRDRDTDPLGWATDRAERLDRTLVAMASGVPLIWNPRLPTDLGGRRSGEPDLLVLASCDGAATYIPVDVKAHHALVPSARTSGGSVRDFIAAGSPSIELVGSAESLHREDLLQLAHYWRMLEVVGRAPAGDPRGAIIGWSGRIEGPPLVGWFDLSSTMEEYDVAFGHAQAVVDRAVSIAAGAEAPALGRPWYEASCHECGWRGICGPHLVEIDHVSLVKPPRRLRDEIDRLGIETVEGLADLDPATLRADGSTIGENVLWREAIVRARMARAGDPPPFALLPEVRGGEYRVPRLWRREDAPTTWTLSRRDVELDVDMESVTSGAYLWGTLLSYAPGVEAEEGFPAGYRAFGGAFETPGDHTTASVFREFLEFITALRAACDRSGRTFGAYCYAGPAAEEPAMRRSAALLAELGGPDLSDHVEALISSADWVDLLEELRARVRSLNGLGLKIAARATGFDWRSGDAGGEASMRWYERATTDADPALRAAFRSKILEYNEDDVAATRHLRRWFSEHPPAELRQVP
jgi:predicted RecB family nuclease